MAEGRNDLTHMLIVGAPRQLGAQWRLSAMSLSFPSDSFHRSVYASSQHDDWFSKNSIKTSKGGNCVAP